jgi:hypothetical protein
MSKKPEKTSYTDLHKAQTVPTPKPKAKAKQVAPKPKAKQASPNPLDALLETTQAVSNLSISPANLSAQLANNPASEISGESLANSLLPISVQTDASIPIVSPELAEIANRARRLPNEIDDSDDVPSAESNSSTVTPEPSQEDDIMNAFDK